MLLLQTPCGPGKVSLFTLDRRTVAMKYVRCDSFFRCAQLKYGGDRTSVQGHLGNKPLPRCAVSRVVRAPVQESEYPLQTHFRNNSFVPLTGLAKAAKTSLQSHENGRDSSRNLAGSALKWLSRYFGFGASQTVQSKSSAVLYSSGIHPCLSSTISTTNSA
jgi:hypothetical protein